MNESPSQPVSGPSSEQPDPGRPTHPNWETKTGPEAAERVRPASLARRHEELRADQSRRWRQGDCRPVEAYLADHPDLAGDREFVLALVNGEIFQREERGEAVRLDEYLDRFPALADRLRALFAILERVREATTSQYATVSPPTIASDAEPPVYLDRYRVVSRLGEGTFGIVYLCDDEELRRRVALKVPHREHLAGPDEAEKYLEEARALALLDHPGIVPIYDVGRTPDGLCFFVSKYVEGGSLAARLRQGRPEPTEAAALVAEVAEALQHAHERGLVHRDVKPANILLDAAGRPVVADFGLALREQDFGRGAGTVLGTPAYMSPEQARGEGHRVDARSDVYSLGAVFYELLTGRLPFEGSAAAIMEQIRRYEPRPPRQFNAALPHELDRVCLKAMASRASDRYSTARDLADELRAWLAVTGASPDPTARAGASPEPVAPAPSPPPEVRVVPKGLRAFGAEDADSFLRLLPGPRGRDGLPDSVRFWKARLEETDPDATFPVGLLFGPSGCGKSSLVRAGVLPRLAPHVVAAYVEATPHDTESRLARVLRKHCPDVPPKATLAEALMHLRRGAGLPAGQKLLIVLDQFEQWLNAHPAAQAAELTEALRQCDGGRVQCLLLVRDDFGMAAARFLRELEVPIIEGRNFATVDLFDTRHARKVLAEFGRAFGCLPDDLGALTVEQSSFLDQAVIGLAEEGRVISVRLALFAEMVKARPWTAATLKDVGGAAGIGLAFLEESLGPRAANPSHRLHSRAARAVLQALLPQPGSDLKGTMRSHAQLLEASGYAAQPREFEELLRVLDHELRLITPTDPEGAAGDATRSSAPDTREPYYQLTHDYLVPSLREWLTQKQKQTRRGRAELLLQDRRQTWERAREDRLLPSPLEVVMILWWTRRNSRAAADRMMLRRALWLHGRRAVIGVAFVAAVALLAWRAASQRRTPLDQFLDRSAPPKVRVEAIARLSLEDEGVMAQVLWAVRDDHEPALVAPALERLTDRVAAGRIPPPGRDSFIALLQDLLANSALDQAIHRAAFDSLRKVGRPGEVLGGILRYLRVEGAPPLEAEFLRYLRETPEGAAAYRGDADEAARARAELAKLLPALARRRTGDQRAEPLRLFAEVVPPEAALAVVAAQYRAAQEPELVSLLRPCVERLDLPNLREETRRDVLWQLAELLRDPGVEDGVKAACVGVLDHEEAGALCDQLFEVYFRGKGAGGTDGKGTAPDPDESPDVVLMPYAERTGPARLRKVQDHVRRKLADLVAQRDGDGQIPTSDGLPYLVQAVGRLRQKAGKPWPAALDVVAGLLRDYGALEDQSVYPLLLGAVAALGNDGPIELQPVRDMLKSPGMSTQTRTAAAHAVGELHDAASIDGLIAAADPKNVPSLRIAALRALGQVGRYLRQQGQPVGKIADFLQRVLERRGEESDSRFIGESLTAFGEVADPARITVVFDLAIVDAYSSGAFGVVHRLMSQTEADCRGVTRAFLLWRAGKPADLGKDKMVQPDDLLFFWGVYWRPRKVVFGDAGKAMKVVALTLAEASEDERLPVRQVAARLLTRVVPDAPALDAAALPAARAERLRAWRGWWEQNAERLHLGPRGLTPK